MRIQIRVYKKANHDGDCLKPDYLVTAPTVDMAIEELGSLERLMEKESRLDEIQEDTTSMEEKLEAVDEEIEQANKPN